jgi:signal transduction protein with GAF and PtsI domain
MPKSKPLTADALAELGADRLAALLLDAAEHDATVARTLRIAVAARAAPIRPLRQSMPRSDG